MFHQLIVTVPVPNPPSNDSIMWMRKDAEVRRYKANLSTIWNGEEFRFYEYEVIELGEIELQLAVAGFTHIMMPADAETQLIVDTFNDINSGLWLTYSEAIQAGKPAVEALRLAFDLDVAENFDRLFWLKHKED